MAPPIVETLPRKRIWKKTAPILGVPCFLFLFGFVYYFWSNAGRGESAFHVSRYAVLRAMLALKFTSAPYIVVDEKQKVILRRTQIERYPSGLNAYMHLDGWKYFDQMGAILFYRKGTQQTKVQDLAMTQSFHLDKVKGEP